jgi:hypothetical protein
VRSVNPIDKPQELKRSLRHSETPFILKAARNGACLKIRPDVKGPQVKRRLHRQRSSGPPHFPDAAAHLFSKTKSCAWQAPRRVGLKSRAAAAALDNQRRRQTAQHKTHPQKKSGCRK